MLNLNEISWIDLNTESKLEKKFKKIRKFVHELVFLQKKNFFTKQRKRLKPGYI